MAEKKTKNKYQDSDADGLPDELEKKIGVNPYKADSDGDGVNDYEEINIFGTDPLNPDTDGDGWKDGEEIKRGRNPKGPGLLKDLFIPHAGNNFQPKALHPYRLLFYALISILLKTILIGAVLILPIEAWLTPDILIEQSQKIINLTNNLRKSLNILPLAESLLLNQAAYDKAQDMLLNQYFSHIGPDNKSLADWLSKIKYNFAVAGENLAIGFSGPEEVVNGWTKSQTHYQNMVDPDFKEIGVGMTSGLYENIDTTLVAQYFAAPKPIVLANGSTGPAESITFETRLPLAKAQPKEAAQILGEKAEEPPPAGLELAPADQTIDNKAPEIDLDKSKLYVDEPQGQNEKIVRAEVYLTPDTAKAWVSFNNYFIELKPSSEDASQWTGQTIVFEQGQEQIFNPVVLAAITAEDRVGNKITADLPWANLKPANTTALEQYFFIKQHQSSFIKPLFDITSIYYKIVLVIASIALALNILIEIKRQYPHIIISTLGLICLLIAFIII